MPARRTPAPANVWVAAKLYREYSLRSSHNMSQYQQGRALLDDDGNAPRAARARRPGGGKSSKRGKEAARTSWLMHEFTCSRACTPGVPTSPSRSSTAEHALLMEYIGDDADAAPTLNDVAARARTRPNACSSVSIQRRATARVGLGSRRPVGVQHLYHRGRIVLIDFPQVADCRNNPEGARALQRDIERVARYFASFGHATDARQLAEELWSKHVSVVDAGD